MPVVERHGNDRADREKRDMGNGHDGGQARDDEIEVAVVGLGYWGPNRIRVLLETREAAVTTVCDLSERRLEAIATRYPSARSSNNFDEVVDDPALDAILIATPVSTHAALATRALEAGKHVFVEKPLAASSGEARELVLLAEDRDRVLMCGHTFLHSPPVQLVKQILDAGELGDLHYVSSSRVNLGPYRSDVSVVFDLGPHDFSILLHWLDEMPRSMTAIGRDVIRSGVCDFAFINAIFRQRARRQRRAELARAEQDAPNRPRRQ